MRTTPAQVAATLRIPMLILQGERNDQVTQADLEGWRSALRGRSDVTVKSYPNRTRPPHRWRHPRSRVPVVSRCIAAFAGLLN